MRKVLAALCVVLSASLTAEHVRIDVKNVPVDRLIANLSRQVSEKPADLEVRINLARVYSRDRVNGVSERGEVRPGISLHSQQRTQLRTNLREYRIGH